MQECSSGFQLDAVSPENLKANLDSVFRESQYQVAPGTEGKSLQYWAQHGLTRSGSLGAVRHIEPDDLKALRWEARRILRPQTTLMPGSLLKGPGSQDKS